MRIFLLFFLLTSIAFADQLDVVLEQSEITWVGKKVSGEHDGTLGLKSASLEVEDRQITGGKFVFDMNQIENLDIESETYKKKLEDHLKSPDFFDTAKHPEGSFTIKRVKGSIDDDKLTIIGDLTLKGITNPVMFDTDLHRMDGGYHAIGTTMIDRTKWDLKYNSGKFFSVTKLGDKLINDQIEVGIEIFAK